MARGTLSFLLLLLLLHLAATPTTAQHRRPAIPAHIGKELRPNGIKAGSAGSLAVEWWKDHLGWFYDKSPNPVGNDGREGGEGPLAVPMLWGSGRANDQDKQWFQEFKLRRGPQPVYLLGMHRPDRMTANLPKGLSPWAAASLWNKYIAPYGKRGALLGSPSVLATEHDRWMYRFAKGQLGWDFHYTCLHMYVPDLESVKRYVDHYWTWYAKLIWITEFGCAPDSERTIPHRPSPCDDQEYVNRLIRSMVDFFEIDTRIAAYAYPEINEHCDLCNPVTPDAFNLTESGHTYLDAISQYN